MPIKATLRPRETKSYMHTKICTQMFIAALFTGAKDSSSDEWINKMWSILAMEYYSAIKRNEVLTHATAWMNLENIMLSEVNQIQKTIYDFIYIKCPG